MVKEQQMSTTVQSNSNPLAKPSMLEQFSLGFEYNKTLQVVRREVRVRTHKG